MHFICWLRTNRVRDQEPSKQIENDVKRRLRNRSYREIWRYRNHQHSQVSEVQKCTEHGVEIPEHLIHRPIVSDHRICNNREHDRLG